MSTAIVDETPEASSQWYQKGTLLLKSDASFEGRRLTQIFSLTVRRRVGVQNRRINPTFPLEKHQSPVPVCLKEHFSQALLSIAVVCNTTGVCWDAWIHRMEEARERVARFINARSKEEIEVHTQHFLIADCEKGH